MLVTLLFQVKMFLFIMSIFMVLTSFLHIIAIFRFKQGKLIPSTKGLTLFGMSLAYIITMLICGF